MKRKNKVLALLLSLLLAVSIFPLSAMATEATGSEVSTVSTDAAAISTVEQFLGMTSGKDYYLTEDIDFSKESDDWSGDNSAYTFDETTGELVVRNLVASFYGTLNGNGNTISGFKFTYTATEATATENVCIGVFGELGNGTYSTVISNLKIGTENSAIVAKFNDSVTTNYTIDGTDTKTILAFGYVCGWATAGRSVTLNNIYVNGDVEGVLGTRNGISIGGLVGDSYRQSLTVNDSSFNGSIVVSSDRTGNHSYIGGIVAFFRSRDGLRGTVNNCVNNAALSITYTGEGAPTDASSVGGIVGTTYLANVITNCANNGTLTAGGDTHLGGILGYDATTVLVLIADSSTTSGDIYGSYKSGARICVAGCKSGEAASDQNSEMTAIASVDDFDKLEGSDGFFCLANNIDFEDVTQTTFVVTNFNGVLYGNGYTIKNLKFGTTGDTGFFKVLSNEKESAIINLNMGTASKPVEVRATGSGKVHSVLAVKCNTAYNAIISQVNIYADMYVEAENVNAVGGFMAMGSAQDIMNCNFYGTITTNSTNNTNTDYKADVAGFVGYLARPADPNRDQKISCMLNCNNFANINVCSTAESTLPMTVAGFIASDPTARGSVIANSTNFGDISVGDECTISHVGSIVGWKDWGHLYVADCENFGDISGVYAGSVLGSSRGSSNGNTGLYSSVNGFEDYGRVTAGYETPNNSYVCYTGTDLNTVVNVKTEAGNIIGMKDGASIRIDPVVTGLRYKANISEDALAKLEEIFGEGTVSYGTIIAPEAFITAAGNEFTMDALDKLAESRKDLFANGNKAYVDIPATQWFVGEDGEEKGVISGSIVNMSGLYKDRFVGRAYIKVTVGNDVVYTLYADYFENDVENSTRTVEQVTSSALNDLIYVKDQIYYTYNSETKVYTKIPAEKLDAYKVEYTLDVGAKDGYERYSGYTQEEYDDLTDLLALING
ncbi:MAG: hypothetical protein IJ011_00405 [Clostridia bacterium]|nr:hypothetical protein [Clostridia bacterium]